MSFLIQPVSGSCISDKDGSSKFRIGIQLEAVFDHMLVLIVPASSAAMDHKAAVRDSGMIAKKLFLRDEVNRSVIVGKIIRHIDNGLLDFLQVSSWFCHYKAFAGVFLAGAKIGITAAAHSL